MPQPGKAILSTLFAVDPPMEIWRERVAMLAPASRASTIAQILRRAGNYELVVLDGSGSRDQIAAVLLRARRHRPAIVMADATWKRDPRRWRHLVDRVGVRLIDGPRTTFCVLSSAEVTAFPRTWGPLRGAVRFVPWPWTLKRTDLDSVVSDGGRVFAGGNSLRDYDTVIEAAASIDAPIDLASSALTASQLAACPPNVVAGPLSQPDYDARLFSASVIVVPLRSRPDRSSGQTTYVNAMALGKAIVVTDTPGVRDYITDGETGLIVPPGDPGALSDAVRGLLDDPDRRRLLGERACARARSSMTLTDYARRLLQVADETLA